MRKLTILHIDDDPDDREFFNAAMSEISGEIACHSESSAQSALSKLSSGEIIPQTIFLDINMPMMNGQEFLQEIKKNQELRHIPVIAFSTASIPETIREMISLGASDFIVKPSSFRDLVNTLKKALEMAVFC